ncbi:MAG: hypothetical protein GY856_35965 [bacterium]|nr:hypothetical protein [bacterium]
MRKPTPIVSRGSGFSLLEALVALALMGFAMLFTIALICEEPRIERRIEAHGEAIRLLEAQLETIRADPDISEGEIDVKTLPLPEEPVAENLRMWTEFELLPERELYKLTLTARYSVGRQVFEQSLETMIWVP